MTLPWHAPLEEIGAYLTDSLDQATAASVEAHLLGCPRCREALAAASDAADPGLRERTWAAIEAAVDDEPASRIERLAGRLGVEDRDARTLAPTRSLKLTWVAATLIALLSAALLARRAGAGLDSLSRLAFLTVAPLAPLAAVVAALGAASEPAPELARTTSAPRLRIAAARATTVVIAATLMGSLASALLPGRWVDAVVWLLPAMALSILGALVAGRAAPAVAVGWLGSVWVLGVVVAARVTDDRLAAFRPPAHLLYVAVMIAGGLFIATRPDSLDLRRST